ncbi:MAG: ferritin family protein [Desulfobacterales bacterium]|nr:ferritin family protein [Desulfobacterales bacterium]
MDLEKYKDAISDAIAAEIEAKKFYKKVAEKIKDDYLKKLFGTFAREEAKHEEILTGILNQETMDTSVFNFEKDFKVAETITMPAVNQEMDLKDAIAVAMKNEEFAMKKYMALAENCDDTRLKKVFEDLAAMERDHKFKMEEYFVDIAYTEVW